MDKHEFTLLCLILLATVTLTVVSKHTGSIIKERSLGYSNHTYDNKAIVNREKSNHNKKPHHHKKIHHNKKQGKTKHHQHHGHGNQLDKLVYGAINRSACSLCEPLVGQTVCGTDGNTYVTLCHAVNCAGLTEGEVIMGACTETSVCQQAKCKKRTTCIPKLAHCIPWKDSSGKLIPCQVHHCATECTTNTDVCGMDGKTYSSLCSLYEAGTLLAYKGTCNPIKCQSAVCGTDGKTYHSSCHAKAQGAQVHYTGNCFSDRQLDYQYKRGSVCNLIVTRCKKVTCIEPFLPPDSCCRMCGGGLLLQQKAVTKTSSRIIKKFNYNSISTIRSAIIDLLPIETEEACDLSVTLTNNGYIVILLEPIVHHRSLFCEAASRELAGRISNPPSSLEVPTSLLMELYEVHIPDLSSTLPGLPTPAMFIGFNPLGDLQDTSDDLKNQAKDEAGNTYGGGVEKFDNHLSDVENKAYDNSAIMTKFSNIITTINIILVTVI